MRDLLSNEIQFIAGGHPSLQGDSEAVTSRRCKPWEEIAHCIASLLYDISFNMLLHSKIRKKYDNYND